MLYTSDWESDEVAAIIRDIKRNRACRMNYVGSENTSNLLMAWNPSGRDKICQLNLTETETERRR